MNLAKPYLLRSSNLVRADMPAALMQVMRLVSEARLPDRRVFTSPETQIQWLAEVTTPKELDRLKEFVAR